MRKSPPPFSQAHREKISRAMKGRVFTPEWRERISLAKKGEKRNAEARKKYSLAKIGKPSPMKGRKHSEEARKKMSLSRIGQHAGPDHYAWIFDRSKLAKAQLRSDPSYKEWRKQVWLRDNFKCKIANPDCSGKIEAHHILRWKDYPELRYQLNNGITLCHSHHPRKREEEKRLASIFQELVTVSKDSFV